MTIRCANNQCAHTLTPSASNPLGFCASCRARFFGRMP